MRCWKAVSATAISLSLLGASAQAATFCTAPDELAALRTAALQQELMVAGLTCQAMDAYNRFVLAYRPELQRSDADLKTYFIKRNGRRGEADYDTFKTKLANLSSLSEISNTSGFCAATRAAFNLVGRQSLAQFVAEQRLLIALPEQQLCVAEPARPVMAGVEAPDASLRLATVEPQPRKNPSASPYGPREQWPRTRTAPPPAYPSQQNYDSRDNGEDYDDEDEDAVPIPPSLQRPTRPAAIQARRYGQDPYYYYYGR